MILTFILCCTIFYLPLPQYQTDENLETKQKNREKLIILRKIISILSCRRDLQALYRSIADWTFISISNSTSLSNKLAVAASNKSSGILNDDLKVKHDANDNKEFSSNSINIPSDINQLSVNNISDRLKLNQMCITTKLIAQQLIKRIDIINHIFGFDKVKKESSVIPVKSENGDDIPTQSGNYPNNSTINPDNIQLDNLDICSHHDHPDIAFAFNDVLVKTAQTIAIRHIDIIPFSKCLKHLHNICNEVIHVCSIFEDFNQLFNQHTLDYEMILHTTSSLSSSKLHLLSRSLYLGECKLYSIKFIMNLAYYKLRDLFNIFLIIVLASFYYVSSVYYILL